MRSNIRQKTGFSWVSTKSLVEKNNLLSKNKKIERVDENRF
jgi:hypothetical protein